jgi:GntR family transcriptional regulator
VTWIKHQVATGKLKPGEHLPTVRELAAEMKINPNTVSRAYDILDQDQVISTQQGRGTYVRERPDQDHLTRMRQEQLRAIVNAAVGRALSMGYSRKQLKEAFADELERWSNAEKEK